MAAPSASPWSKSSKSATRKLRVPPALAVVGARAGAAAGSSARARVRARRVHREAVLWDRSSGAWSKGQVGLRMIMPMVSR